MTQAAHWVCKRCKDGGDIYHLVERIRRCSHDFAVRFVSRLHAVSQQRQTKTDTVLPPQAPAGKSMADARLAAPAQGGAPPPAGISGVPKQAPATDPQPLPPQEPLVCASAAPCHQPPVSTGNPEVLKSAAAPLRPDVPKSTAQADASVDSPAAVSPCEAAVAAHCHERARLLATRLLEVEGCQGVTVVFDGQGEHWLDGFALSDLDEKALFALDHWMNLTLFRLANLLGGADARQDALFAFTGLADSELKLLWFPLAIDGLPCHLLAKTQSNKSETLLRRRLRSCIDGLQGPQP